ncbi:glycosyl hydrolases family 38 N-terminal domain-containing protein [Sphaerosporella brunnea]|uniref:Alpha-mannosidase n=1 Tax=Sphaerosporella brunnea TaxID=1250544 RepID=A0A5J5EDD0_9PEZI|nr:glycosyl hydrolases family 38 N-terminal domain-containing protein [Sphaerosporella brunnea]
MGGGSKPASAQETGYPQLNLTPKGAQIRDIYQSRIKNFTAKGQYQGVNLRAALDLDSEASPPYVRLEVYSVPDLARPTFHEAVKGEFRPTGQGASFGPSWSTHWFRVTIRVPERMRDYERVQFRWDSNSEAMVWTADGEAVQGLTGGGERTEWIFPQLWKTDGKEHSFYVEMACNGMFGNPPGDIIQPPNPHRTFCLDHASIYAPNLEAWALYIDYWILGDASREFPSDSWEAHTATQLANEIVNTFVVGDQESIKKCRQIAAKYLGHEASSADVYKSGKTPLVFGTGHCHIDTAWLWPFDETKRKVARSWASQCNLMDQYPEHRFTCSSAQQYKWLEKLYPKTFDRVRQKVHEGKFQYIGGSWVEHDTNMPSGESLSRQFILGQRYFESRFGARCSTFWLPDTFGYSAQLPQLCRLAGMSRFFTQKLSWNNVNTFPHTTFNWISLDGSQVLCHMPPSETYTAEAHFGDVKRSVSQHKSLDQDNTSLLVFGKGDGGGGPTWQQIEKLRRCRGMSDTVGLLPRVHMGNSVDEFFANLEKKELEGNKFVTWYGELYLEFHRGTYTTQSNNKKGNRKAEVLMKDLEMLATYASLQTDYRYPKQEIDDMWEDICLMQFHDCLPGSCIEMVYRDTDRLYAALFEKGQKIVKEALEAMGISDAPLEHASPHVINTHQWKRSEVVKIPGNVNTANALGQKQDDYALALCDLGADIAQLSYGIGTPTVSITKNTGGAYVLQNDNLKVTVDGGVITSLVFLPHNREVIPKGQKANQLVIFDDKPLYWQAWDVEVYHFETRKEIVPTSVSVLSEGPLRAALLVESRISEKSCIKTKISLDAAIDGAGSYVAFESEVEWHETMKFLKVEFPVDVVNTEASYETQYGILKRPTHYNTSWDMAKFEVCCQKWADLSEHGFGVSILNDCKYGFATAGNVMRLSLIRAPKAPDAHADMGSHSFRYAMFPHEGSVGEATVQTAADFNNPLKIGYILPENLPKAKHILRSVVVTKQSSIILDTIKRGEDDEDVSVGGLPTRKGRSLVLRFYESLGGRARTSIFTKLPVKKVFKTNLLEDDLEELHFETLEINGELYTDIGLQLRPFEVQTVRLQL